MILYALNSSLYNTLPTDGSATVIGQRPDCSEFLILSNAPIIGLDELQTVPEGFDFTYCQGWGLTITDEVINRVVNDLRRKAYPPPVDYMDGMVKGDAEQMQAYIDACLAVKLRYPK